MKYFLPISLLVLTSIFTQAQISGSITDSKNRKAIAEVEVFIDGTSYITMSDEAGKFVINGLPPGFVDLALYKKGYLLFKSSVRIVVGKAYTLNLTLEPSEKAKTVKGSEAKNNEEDLQKLEEALFGKENISYCAIINQEVLSFSKTDAGTVIKSNGPLVIDNNILGLQLRYFLQEAILAKDKSEHNGIINFQPMPIQSSDQMALWADNRMNAYHGSTRHMLQSLVTGTSDKEGFEWKDKAGKHLQATTLIATSSLPGYHKFVLTDTTEVIYKTKTGELQSTKIFQHGSIEINNSGKLLNNKNLVILGHMNDNSLSARLPHDYEPLVTAPEDYTRFYEKVYVHTDKPYYYPGEPMWYKGYINYKNPTWRDSLSKVLYVELINPKKEIVLSKILKIDSGFFNNDFILPDTLKEGLYFLRAYTHLNRNFGDSSLYIKHISILNITDKVDRSQGIMQASQCDLLTIAPDKKEYKKRELITLKVRFKDKEGKPLASNLSLAVTDAIQVVPIAESVTILNGFSFGKEKQTRSMAFKYPMEYGISLNGKFLNDKGKPEKTGLTILQTKPRNVMLTETNEQGIFSQTGLIFYDSVVFSFKADKAKDSPYGKVELLPREVPPINIQPVHYNLTVQSTQSQQRIISDYEVPLDVRLLEGVTIKGQKIEETNKTRPYGKAEHIIKAKDIKASYGNLLYSLQGTVPGLIVQQDGGSWQVFTTRARSSSISNSREVVVMVNDALMGGSPGDILSAIDPATVESIEVTTHVNVLLGSLGASGIIYVYTKSGPLQTDTETVKNFTKAKAMGYSTERNFNAPDYGNPKTDTSKTDFRSTIYWNPEVVTNSVTGAADISFYASDLPGTYRIVGEGITQTGEPVRSIVFITVESD